MLNSPVADDSIVYYDVRTIDVTHKMIFAMQSVTGKIYIRNVHDDNNGSPSGWSYVPRYTQLWSGYVGDIGAKLTLTEDVSKYVDIRVLLDNGNGHQMYQTVRKSTASEVCLTDTHTWTTGYNNFEMKISLSGKTITILSNVNINVNLKGEGTSMESAVKIKQIEGVS